MIIPRHIQIENVYGYCTSNCIMCARSKAKNNPKIMDNATFKRILEKFSSFIENIDYLTIHGLGEPLLDKEHGNKVKIAKDMGFRGVGFATNCTELSKEISVELLENGLDTIICSIDGFTKETHEAIRIGTNFESIVSNVKNFIHLRNQTKKPTKVLIRFIRQLKNQQEWDQFYDYWMEIIDNFYGDDVIKFDVHNCGGELEEYLLHDVHRDVTLDKIKCTDLYDRMWIRVDGRISLCDGDYDMAMTTGNALTDNPIRIFNSNPFTHYRKSLEAGKWRELEYCSTCTIPRSRLLKT